MAQMFFSSFFFLFILISRFLPLSENHGLILFNATENEWTREANMGGIHRVNKLQKSYSMTLAEVAFV